MDASTELADDFNPLLEAQFRTRRSLNHVLFRDRRYRLLLEQAEESLEDDQPLAAFDQLLELAGASEDVFVWEESKRSPISARTACLVLISRLSTADRERFDRYIGGAANSELEAALTAGDSGRIRSVAVRYPGTAAGSRALRLLAVQLLDAGRAEEAAAAWRELILTSGSSALTHQDRLQACMAARLSGDEHLLSRAFAESQSLISIGSTSLTLRAWLDLPPPDVVRGDVAMDAVSPHWTSPYGAVTGSRIKDGTAPYHVPVWRQEAADDTAAVPERTMSMQHQLLALSPPVHAADHGEVEWSEGCRRNEDAPASAFSPVIVNGCVVIRESAGIVARRIETGAVAWRHRCETWLDGSDVSETDDPPAFTQSCAENALLLSLTTDGRRLFAVDGLKEVRSGTVAPMSAKALASDPANGGRLVNQIVAIELPETQTSDGLSPHAMAMPIAWRTGEAGADAALAEHFFLGSPVPVGNALLVVSECRGQINLVGLDAATGRVRFVQGLALVDRPITRESDRLRLNFMPAVRNGMVVAPTPCGAVVAFDLATHSLLWTAQYRALDTAVSTSWRGDGRSHAALHPVQPVIVDGHVLLLPPDSVEIIAIGAENGERLWSIPRRGVSQIAVLPNGLCLLTSADRVNCLDIGSGETIWERSTALITGRGVVVGETYIVPQADGQLLALDVASGRSATGGAEILSVATFQHEANAPLLSTRARATDNPVDVAIAARRPAGNLIACGDWIVSASPVELAAYLEAAPLLEIAGESSDTEDPGRVREEQSGRAVLSEKTAGWTAEQRRLHLAELELTLGNGAAALPHLLAIIEGTAPVDADDETRSLRSRSELLLRELVYWQLESGGDKDRSAALDRLARLAHTEVESARWHLAVMQHAADAGDLTQWLTAARAIAQLPDDLLVPVDVARSRQIHPAAAIPSSQLRLLSRLTADERGLLVAEATRGWRSLSKSTDVRELEQFVRLFDSGRVVDRARVRLARLTGDSGARLAAEAWLLNVHPEIDSPLERNMQRLLVGLERHRKTSRPSPGLVTGAVAEFAPQPRNRVRNPDPESSGVVQVAMRTDVFDLDFDIDWLRNDAPRVEISSHPIDPDAPINSLDLSALLQKRPELKSAPESRVRIMNLGDPRLDTPHATGVPPKAGDLEGRPQVQLAVVDRDTSVVTGRILVPARYREALPHFQPDVGSFLPVADCELHGLSLLDGKRLWTATVAGGDRSDRVRLGPSGPGYCLAQVADGLCCLDPVRGTMLWQRRDVAADEGLFANEETGLFGDADRVVLVAGDQRNCRVFSTKTGELLHAAMLPTTETRRSRLAFGSRLFFASGGDEDPRFRLWDSESCTLLVDEPARYPFRHHRVDRDHVAYLADDGAVVVLKVSNAQELLRHALTEDQVASLTGTGIVVWRDPEQWYVQTLHSGMSTGNSRVENVTNDVTIPSVTANGLLSAYDGSTYARLWSRVIESRTILIEPQRAVPFLVCLHRTREGMSAEPGGLTVEILDKQTGDLLGELTDLPQTRFVHSGFSEPRREFTLYGETLRIDVRYELPRSGVLFAAER